MADNGEFKALVRRRMEATGEKYTEAYRALLRAAESEVIPSTARRVLPRVTATPEDEPDPGTRRIGRRPDNDIVVMDLGVSKRHADLRRSPDGQCTIIDLGSHNGTYVNGTRVDQAELAEGDIVSIGQATFRFSGGELSPCPGGCSVRVFKEGNPGRDIRRRPPPA